MIEINYIILFSLRYSKDLIQCTLSMKTEQREKERPKLLRLVVLPLRVYSSRTFLGYRSFLDSVSKIVGRSLTQDGC